MSKSTSTKSSGYTLPTIPEGRIINLRTGESTPYGTQEIPEQLFEAVLADAAIFMGLTLKRR